MDDVIHSSTAAIVALLQNITTMLLTNDYVVVISTDLSKAFDTVRHSSLAEKLAALDIPDLVYNWLVSYYHNRGHVTSYAGVTSLVAYINASVVQGSAVGPSSFVVGASDLRPKNKPNRIVKYADDTYLLIGSSHLKTIAEEFDGISAWAEKNNLRLNATKTREKVVAGRGSIAPLFHL